MKHIIVIAFKYNDIFYALSTNEWKYPCKKTLLILYDALSANSFPCQNEFDAIIHLRYKSTSFGLLKAIFCIFFLRKRLHANTLFLSNPILIINQFILKVSCCSNVILLEDGLMNYYNFEPSISISKKIVQKILHINNLEMYNRVSKTYLLKPNKAIYFKGNKSQLNINANIPNIAYHEIQGRSIFVGQNLYQYGLISIDDYNQLVNMIIGKFGIEYYLPHPFASSMEDVKSPVLNINSKALTLEILSNNYSFRLYSFGSSVLYTCKCINKDVETYLINSKIINNSTLTIIKESCNGIIEV